MTHRVTPGKIKNVPSIVRPILIAVIPATLLILLTPASILSRSSDNAPTVIELKRQESQWYVDTYFDLDIVASALGRPVKVEEDQDLVSLTKEAIKLYNSQGLLIQAGDGAYRLFEDRVMVRLLLDSSFDVAAPFTVNVHAPFKSRKSLVYFRYKDYGQTIEMKLNSHNKFMGHIDILRAFAASEKE